VKSGKEEEKRASVAIVGCQTQLITIKHLTTNQEVMTICLVSIKKQSLCCLLYVHFSIKISANVAV